LVLPLRTSPAANQPVTLDCIAASVTTKPSGSVSTLSRTSSLFGVSPTNTKAAGTSTVERVPSTVLRRTTLVSLPSRASSSTGSVLVRTSISGCASTFSATERLADSCGSRVTRVTCSPSVVRNRLSSAAELPPPTTRTGWSR
jgi:hypothetical protein